MMNVRSLIAMALFSALACHRLAAAYNRDAPVFTHLSGTVVVSAEVANQSLYVNVRINGRGPFRMLVDTGASVAFVTPSVAAAVEARDVSEHSGPTVSINAFGEYANIHRVLLRTLEIGDAKFDGVTAGVTNDCGMLGLADGKPIDGILGFSVFSDVVLSLDFPGKRMLMSTHWPSGLPPVRTELAVVEPMEVPRVVAQLQGRQIEMLIDTGANHGIGLPPELAGLTSWKAEPRPSPLVQAAGSRAREYIGRITGELRLGSVVEESPIIDVTNGSPSIGVGFLKGFCVVFDQSQNKMWLCSNSDAEVPAPAERSLGMSLLADTDGWRVAGTIPGSPAEEAGIVTGDVVTRIEGESARDWSRDRLENWTVSHDKVELSVASIDQSRELVLPVWSLVP